MATRSISFKVCDGCSRSDLFDDVEIVNSARKRPYLDNDYGTLDICHICAGADLYICNRCHAIHGDDNPCAAQLREIGE
jgi:hypothetical protein